MAARSRVRLGLLVSGLTVVVVQALEVTRQRLEEALKEAGVSFSGQQLKSVWKTLENEAPVEDDVSNRILSAASSLAEEASFMNEMIALFNPSNVLFCVGKISLSLMWTIARDC